MRFKAFACATASLVSIGFSPNSNINLSSITLKGLPFTLSAQGNFETAIPARW